MEAVDKWQTRHGGERIWQWLARIGEKTEELPLFQPKEEKGKAVTECYSEKC